MIRIYVLLSLCVAYLMSCSNDEQTVKGIDEQFSVCRFDFPQGTTEVDKVIKEIHDSSGTYIIYKDIKEKDLTRSWTDPDGTSFEFELLDESSVTKYVNFLQTCLFDQIKGQYCQYSCPVYFYLLKSLKSVKGARETILDLKTDGLDYWALALNEDELDNLQNIDFSSLKNRIIYPVLEILVEKGIVTVPAIFYSGIDYETSISSDPDDYFGYYRDRGFVDFVDEDSFTSMSVPKLSRLASNNGDLLSYIRVAIMLTEEEFGLEYVQEKCPLIHRRYGILTSHLKDNYGIDLKAIAKVNKV